jgi:hypothetical protein
MKEDFSALNRTFNINGPDIIEFSEYEELTWVPSAIQRLHAAERKKKEVILYDRVKRRRLQLAIEKYEIKDYIKKEKYEIIDYIKKPELGIDDGNIIESKPRTPINPEPHIIISKCDCHKKEKKVKIPKNPRVYNITRENLGYIKADLIDKVKQTQFIF